MDRPAHDRLGAALCRPRIRSVQVKREHRLNLWKPRIVIPRHFGFGVP
jgi:hypothetical protein